MEIEEIRECVDFFAKSAIHAVEGGFDGIGDSTGSQFLDQAVPLSGEQSQSG